VKLWFGWSLEDGARKPDRTLIEYAYSPDEVTQAYADTAEIANDDLITGLDEKPDPDELKGV